MLQFRFENLTDCSGVEVGAVYQATQITLLCLILTYIVFINTTVIVVILTTTSLRGCWFSMQMAVSYIANVVAGLSLVGNALYYSEHGNPPIHCQPGCDAYFFLYVGTSMNMMIILFNTRYRYHRIVHMKHSNTMGATTHRHIQHHVFLKSLLPAWLVSVFVSTSASTLQKHVMHYRFLLNIGICSVPMLVTIVWNILLSRYLKNSRRNPVAAQRHESVDMIERAAFMINVSIASHVIFLLVGACATFCISFIEAGNLFIIMWTWILRAAYLMLFTVEAKVYLYKVPVARRVLGRRLDALSKWLCRAGTLVPEVVNNTEASHVRMSSETLEIVVGTL